ncbi:DUF5329 family protein [Spartinivicinus poritis]|uniref:DUF5329 family protein n=1 Tax=Spartinivicinus poritis TaxID=2994640 RepID=A0ABT5UE27_9GAMM|nr:DUF5329 family protein [Spartinivicinus sp. A2-2]MDE1464634.1 DUF5329 family protein [Spartinivicinus sp. A2-2]
MINGWVLLVASMFALVSPTQASEQLANEVSYLKQQVKDTHCRFLYNGKLYQPAAMLDYIERKHGLFKDDISNAEEFIVLAASRSAKTGQPLKIQCPGKPAMKTKGWLLDKLQTYRLMSQSAAN